MGKTLITYQGLIAESVRFVRSRGYDADVSTVTIPLSSFPAGFSFAAPREVLGVVPEPEKIDIASFQPTPRSSFQPAGTLYMGELVDADPLEPGSQAQVFELAVHPLWILRVERVLAGMDAAGNLAEAVVVVYLVDERFFWERGHLAIWSFNRLSIDGRPAPGVVPRTRRSIAESVAADMFRSPKIAAAPATWDALAGPVEFPALGAPVQALRQLVEDGGCLEPCLRLDGTIALHRAGDGHLAYAPEGKGANRSELPLSVRLWEEGTGEGYVVEPQYPPRWIVVRGSERIATVQVDDAEAVFFIDTGVLSVDQQDALARGLLEEAGRRGLKPEQVRARGFKDQGVVPITETSVRTLSRGLFGLEDLKVWVLLPAEAQNSTPLPEPVIRVLQQAWRLWRVRGVGPETPLEESNAHLLPLLDRAETGAEGKRLPVLVEREGFRPVHGPLNPQGSIEGDLTTNDAAQQAAMARIDRAKAAVAQAAAAKIVPDPFRHGTGSDVIIPGRASGFGVAAEAANSAREAERFLTLPTDAVLGDVFQDLTGRGVNAERLQRKIKAARAANAAREVDGAAAADYAKGLEDLYRARGEATDQPELEEWEVAKDLAELDAFLREQRKAGETLAQTASRFRDKVDRVRLKAKLQLEALDRRAKEQANRTRARQPSAGSKPRDVLSYVNNLGRFPDHEARVVSAAQGLLETSALAGTLKFDKVPSPEMAPRGEVQRFVPGRVRVSFGAVLRPRATGAAPTLETQVRKPAGNARPDALGDVVTYFARAYKRGGESRGEELPVDRVPVGESLTVIRRDLPPELIPLPPAEGNTRALELATRATAEGIFAGTAETKVETATYVLGRAWPIQPDGVVAQVLIEDGRGEAPGCGLITTVEVGLRVPTVDPTRTRTRPPAPRDVRDGATREGLRP